MKVWYIRQKHETLSSVKSLYLFVFNLFTKKKTFFSKQIVLFNKFSLRIKTYKNYPFYDSKFKSYRSFSKKINKAISISSKRIMLWIDHSLGGGTQSYSYNKFEEYNDEYVIIRLQYFHLYRSFVISFPNGEFFTGFTLSFDEVKSLFEKLYINKIVLNSLVAYRNINEVLAFVHELHLTNNNIDVTYNVHDFFFICPNCNLISADNKFCGFDIDISCEDCVNKYQSLMPEYEFKLFYDEFINISDWRKMWQKSLLEDVSEVVCFSKSSCEIVNKFYPAISSKLRFVPHVVRPLRQVKVNTHDSVNIAVLGKVDTIPKGKEFIELLSCSIDKFNKELDILCLNKEINNSKSLNQNNSSDKQINIEFELNKKVQIFCIGDYVNAPQNMTVTGAYKREELPDILEKNKIDLVLIPSIWAETFSYTTSEAIAMNVPVACFNLGGQADQVSVYPKGLILELSDSSDIVLDKILDFLSKLS